MRGGQVSIEYLFIMGFAFLLIAPLLVVYYDQAASLGDKTASATIERAAKQIVEAADTVHYLGEPSMRTIAVDLPDNVQGLSVSGRSLSFTVAGAHATYEQVAWSVANLSGAFAITEGTHILEITATEAGVNITERT